MGDTKINIGSTGLITGLTLIFTIAKLWGKVDWSWWWVFSPLWISASVALVILIIVIIIAALTEAFK